MNPSRYEFCRAAFFAGLNTIFVAPLVHAAETLRPLPPEKIFSVLDPATPGFDAIRASLRSGDRDAALRHLLDYYRARATVRYPAPVGHDPAALTRARGVLQHVFDIGLGYPPQKYPADIDWNADPVHDIEWVAGMQRFYWQAALLEAYTATRDEKYVRGWMRLTEDWIRKNPVDPKSFAWLDIQVGLRADNLCAAFERLRTSPSLTPGFLAVFLASIYDHGQKSYLYPRRTPHNKAILEMDGLCRVAIQFPEFKQSAAWLARAFEVMELTLGEQLTPEGVQREWTPGYHHLVAEEMIGLIDLCDCNHRPAPRPLLTMTRRMFDYWLAMTAPDGYPPMFGDTQRVVTDAWPAAQLAPLLTAARIFKCPEFAALAEGRRDALASIHSVAFPKAGMYFLRSGWQPDATYMALHCSPPAISVHDQPDNGTFELYAHGRWLMPDSGSYAYPDTPHAGEREWFRATAHHQTLTLDGRDSVNAPRHLLWRSLDNGDVVAFENASYPELTHRRTVFFLERQYFAILDEALGNARGAIDLHFQFAPGPFSLDNAMKSARTEFPEGANVLLWARKDAEIDLREERGQISYILNRKEPRPAVAYRHRNQAPVAFLTLLIPHVGLRPPEVAAEWQPDFQPGHSRAELRIQIGERHLRCGRDLGSGAAWITRE